jgi:hypothetical protein
MNDLERWQFCNTTHPPSKAAFAIALEAIYSYPCPNEIKYNFSYSIFLSLASLIKLLIGSAPGDNMKIKGVILSISL